MTRLRAPFFCALLGCGALAASSFGSGTGTGTAGVAYVKDAKSPPTVWVANANGSAQRKLGPGSDAVLSPDGSLVAAAGTTGKGPGLYIYKATGGQISLAPPPKGAKSPLNGVGVTPLAWSSDSRYLAVSVADSGTGRGIGNAGLDVVDTTTGDVVVTVPGIVNGASFSPTSPNELVAGLGQSQDFGKQQNLYTVTIGTGPTESAGETELTHDGRSINPVWGSRGILFDRYTLRGVSKAPAYQLELLNGKQERAVASPRPAALLDGLTPVAISSDGDHVLVAFVGEDTDVAYTINLATDRYRMVTGVKYGVQPWGISRDGKRLLVSYGGFESPSTHATIATIPFAGGKPTTLVKGGDLPSWDQ
jgi:hypothetical protein